MGGAPGFQILREGRRRPRSSTGLATSVPMAGRAGPERRRHRLPRGRHPRLYRDRRRDHDVRAHHRRPGLLPDLGRTGQVRRRTSRTLVFVLGNHDLELALPVVQRRILERLAGNDLAARARIEFSTMGAGYSCYVGNARVFCTTATRSTRGTTSATKVWPRRRGASTPDAPSTCRVGAQCRDQDGQGLMNGIKSRYAWIDLLKPETQRRSACCRPRSGAGEPVKRVLPVVGEQSGQRRLDSATLRRRIRRNGVLPADPGRQSCSERTSAGRAARPAVGWSAEDMFQKSESRLGNRARAPDDEDAGDASARLGPAYGLDDGVARDEALRRALLDWLSKTRRSTSTTSDATFKAISPSSARNRFHDYRPHPP